VEKLRRLLVNQKMYTGYIDDRNIMVEVSSSGSRYNREEDKIEIIHELVQSGKDEPGDKRTFEMVREVGNNLEEMIELMADFPSNYNRGMVTNRRTLVQDVVRRMTNCDRRTELEEVGNFLSRFSQKMRECHGGEGKTKVQMKVGRVYGRDNTRRKINEALRIENNEGVRLNGRNRVYQGWLSIATQ
jgi:hypothetical protein